MSECSHTDDRRNGTHKFVVACCNPKFWFSCHWCTVFFHDLEQPHPESKSMGIVKDLQISSNFHGKKIWRNFCNLFFLEQLTLANCFPIECQVKGMKTYDSPAGPLVGNESHFCELKGLWGGAVFFLSLIKGLQAANCVPKVGDINLLNFTI